jgi:protein gp37
MASVSNIAWTDATFNPWIGCTKISPACDRCYAAEYTARYMPKVTWGEPGRRSNLIRTSSSTWQQPHRWHRAAIKYGVRKRVFCASLADVFDNDAEPTWRADLWGVIRATPNLDWQLLTKRPQNIEKMLPFDWGKGWPHVWLGATAENQDEYDRRKRHLLAVPATVHFFSCEPLLGPIDLGDGPRGDWYIAGGETGPGFRVMSMEAVQRLRSQCASRGIAFFFKQDSSLRPGSRGRATEDLWACRQFPKTTVNPPASNDAPADLFTRPT